MSSKVLLEEIKNNDLSGIENPAGETMEFSSLRLPPFLLNGLTRAGFERPTAIQAESIPFLMQGKDLVAQSHTGSGKTAAFAIPMLARIQPQSRDLQALIMVPTRELALQVTEVIRTLAGNAVRVTPVYGGVGMDGQIRGLTRGGYQVVIGTPGRLRDHLNRGNLRLDRLKMLVLDEADEMLDRGFAPDVEAIIQACPPAEKRQTALFSATVPDWVSQTASKYLRPDFATVALEMAPENRPDIEHLVYDMGVMDKNFALKDLLENNSGNPILVFARTKHGVKKLATRLQSVGYAAAGLQGNLSQRAREEVLADFRSKRINVMVATNVGARGLDISGVSHVINYDLPESPEWFTHRVGRTGRNGAAGIAITFLTSEDRGKWREIEHVLKQKSIKFNRKAWDGNRAAPGNVSPFGPDPRPSSGYGPDERGTRSYDRSDERGTRSYDRSDERGGRSYNRSDERSTRSYDRPDGNGNSNSRFARPEQGNESAFSRYQRKRDFQFQDSSSPENSSRRSNSRPDFSRERGKPDYNRAKIGNSYSRKDNMVTSFEK